MKRLIPALALALISGAAMAGEGYDKEGASNFDTLDTNKDQRISSMEAGSDQNVAAAFAKADANKDGYLTREEFASIS